MSVPGRRYVANTNKVVGGMLLHQVRNQKTKCPGKFDGIAPMQCRTSAPSTAGPRQTQLTTSFNKFANPPFLTGVT